MRAKYPSYSVGDVAKELGKRWEQCTARSKFEQLAAKDRARYEKVCSFTNYIFVIAVPWLQKPVFFQKKPNPLCLIGFLVKPSFCRKAPT